MHPFNYIISDELNLTITKTKVGALYKNVLRLKENLCMVYLYLNGNISKGLILSGSGGQYLDILKSLNHQIVIWRNQVINTSFPACYQTPLLPWSHLSRSLARLIILLRLTLLIWVRLVCVRMKEASRDPAIPRGNNQHWWIAIKPFGANWTICIISKRFVLGVKTRYHHSVVGFTE